MATRSYQQRARAVSAEETRRAILDAVSARLQEAPAERISVDRIAKMAGVARSTVYVIFGSRAGLFDALAEDLMTLGFQRVIDAVADPDARVHLRAGITGSVQWFASYRDIARPLYSMALLDPEAVGGAIERVEQNRAGGMAYLAQRLAEQKVLRDDVSEAEAADILWLLTSFDAFDQLYTGRGLDPAQIADRLVTTAERTLCS